MGAAGETGDAEDEEGGVEDSRAAGTDTPRRRRWRRGLVAAAALGAVAAAAWFLFLRIEYHLWRVRSDGHGPSAWVLMNVGPSIVPRIREEIAAAGTADVGPARQAFVRVLCQIRHDVVAEVIGSPILWEVEATLHPVDEEMAAAFRDAFRNEPVAEHRRSMLTWTNELDFEMAVRFFCDAFPAATTDDDRDWLFDLLPTHLVVPREQARTDHFWPWRDLGDEQIAARRAAMAGRLGECAVPAILAALRPAAVAPPSPEDERGLPSFWRSAAARALAAVAPYEPSLGATLRDLLPDVRDRHLAGALLDIVLARATPDAGGAPGAAAAVWLAARHPEPRQAVSWWVRHQDRAAVAAFACRTFGEMDAQARLELLLVLNGLDDDGGPEWSDPACLAETLLAAVETAAPALGPGDVPATWLTHAVALLSRRRGWDGPTRDRAAALPERIPDPGLRQRAERVLAPTPAE